MAKLNPPRRIIQEDFKKEDQDLIGRLGYSLNPVIEQLVLAFNKRITFQENLNSEVKTVTVEVDENGLPLTQIQLQSALTTKVQGVVVIRAIYSDTRPQIKYNINSVSATSPAIITLDSEHSFNTGDRITIEGSNSTPSVDNIYGVRVISSTELEIPENITGAGSSGTLGRALETVPQSSPLITYVENQKIINISHISGLPPRRKFDLVLLTIGALN